MEELERSRREQIFGNSMEVVLTSHFERMAKKLPRALRPLISERVDMFMANPSNPALGTHKLSGNYEGYSAFSVNYQYRILFKQKGKTATFYYIDDHSVYDR